MSRIRQLLSVVPAVLLLFSFWTGKAAATDVLTGSCMTRWLTLSGINTSSISAYERSLRAMRLDESNHQHPLRKRTLPFLFHHYPDDARKFIRCIELRTEQCQRAPPCENGGKCLLDGTGGYYCKYQVGMTRNFCAEATISRYLQKNERQNEKLFTILSRQRAVLPPLLTEVCSNRQTLQQNGIYRIQVSSVPLFSSSCDMTTDSGRWLICQRRISSSEDFYRNYADYVAGFGKRAGDFWLGLETLHKLTSLGKYELRIDLGDWAGNYRYAKYSTFQVGSAKDGYRLNVSGYSGDAGDSLSYHNGKKFTTKDKDQDTELNGQCAHKYKGGWWYGSCHHSNINGLYKKGNVSTYADSVVWLAWKGHYYSLQFTEMKIRLKE